MTSVLVVGGGIAGLTAAADCAAAGCDVTLVEASDRLGGKIESVPFAGLRVDTGPDSFLARVPAAADLARGLGLDLVAPNPGPAYLWARGRLRAFPPGLVLGIPASLRSLGSLWRSGLVGPAAVARAAVDLVLPGSPVSNDDVSVGELVGGRMGRGIERGLVEPLIGGINAGRTAGLSAAVAAPQVLAAAGRDRSLMRALHQVSTAPTPGPVFLTPRGGLADLVSALAATVPGVVVSDPVASLAPAGGGWRAELSSGASVTADGVILAVPAAEAAKLLAPVSAAASSVLASLDTASVVMTLLAYPMPASGPPSGSGFLVPRSEGRLLTAASWVGSKWSHLATTDRLIIRASAGRSDDLRAMAMDDDALVSVLHDELSLVMDLSGLPRETFVRRWPGAFPQYAVGHLSRIAEVEARLAADAPGLVLAGASLRGVGVATCISGGQAAASQLRSHLA